MKNKLRLILISLFSPILASAAIQAGVGKVDMTPPVGTPSAGYTDRKGAGMEGVLDPLYAIALVLDNGTNKIALCSVDHLGFTYDMVQEITSKVHAEAPDCEVYVSSSHTHSGGGAYLNIPMVGESLAGPFNPQMKKEYVEKTAQAILLANKNLIPAKLGIGYGQAAEISTYRASWPEGITPLSDITVIKITKLDDTPFAVVFNYPVHPTVLKSNNRLFSSDFVGPAREQIQSLIGADVEAIYLNGAQGDIIPNKTLSRESVGHSLATTVKTLWDQTTTSEDLELKTEKKTYSFVPQATPFGLLLPVKEYASEMNLLVFNKTHAFITIPGELSCLYDRQLKEFGKTQDFENVSILGLTNDAHGYMITPESWAHKTMESGLSFGGQEYGEQIAEKAKALLKKSSQD